MMASTKDIYTIDPDFYRSYTQEERERQNSQTIVRLFIWTIALVAIMFLAYTWMNNRNTIKMSPIGAFNHSAVSSDIIQENIVHKTEIIATANRERVVVEKKKVVLPQTKIIEPQAVLSQKIEKKVLQKPTLIVEKSVQIKSATPVVLKPQRAIFDELSIEYIEAVRKALGN